MIDRRYPSDLCDEEWELIEELLLKEEGQPSGRPREVDLRRVWDAIGHINKTGCQWAYLPHDFPPPTTVNYHDTKRMKSGFFERANDDVRRRSRKKTVGTRSRPPASSAARA